MKKYKTKYIIIALLSLGAILFSYSYELADNVLVVTRSFSSVLFLCCFAALFTRKEKAGTMMLYACLGSLFSVFLNIEFNFEILLKAVSILVGGSLIYLIILTDRGKTE
jgi:hypothetical protein